jgi:uracil-DNA glycosylase
MPGWGNPLAKLQIWLDSPAEAADKQHKPNVSRQAEFIDWLLRRNSLSLQDVYVGYTLRCFIPKGFLKKKGEREPAITACEKHHNLQICKNAKSIVALGEISCLAFIGSTKVGLVAGSHRDVVGPPRHRVYCDYSPGAVTAPPPAGDPSLSVTISRTIWFAAEYAGLEPRICEKELQKFDFQIF